MSANARTANLLVLAKRIVKPINLPKWTRPNKNNITLSELNEAGVQLLASLASQKNSLVRPIVSFLREWAKLKNNSPSRSPHKILLRLAAAYHLWPYYSAQYYGYMSASRDDRVEARGHLCKIQQLLYKDIHHTLDFLRASFDAFTNTELKSFLVGEKREIGKNGWRPESLLNPNGFPDLCAVDFLAGEMVALEETEPDVIDATSLIRSIALQVNFTKNRHEGVYSRLVRSINSIFHKLGVAQLTLFYDPTPHRDSLPQQSARVFAELGYVATATFPNELGYLATLIPFHIHASYPENRARVKLTPDPDAANFRRLASAIYSSVERSSPTFFAQKRATIETLVSLRFGSSGKTTHQYLTAKRDFAQAWNSFRACWYNYTLSELPDSLCDWGVQSWWQEIGRADLIRHLFPGEHHLFRNAHACALWDYLASKYNHGQWSTLSSWDEFTNFVNAQQPSDREAPTFGYLLEMLLRREELPTRTSFFLGVSRTLRDISTEQWELKEFIGGTFIGLERPGIPYDEERFRQLINHMMGLLLSLMTIASSLIDTERRRIARELKTNIDKILKLLDGDRIYDKTHPSNSSGPPFRLQNYPHAPQAQDYLCNTVRLVMHLKEISQQPGDAFAHCEPGCTDTLKALFYMFAGPCPADATDLSWIPCETNRTASYEKITCTSCLTGILQTIVRSPAKTQRFSVNISANTFLPSFPGIRFIVALANFLNTLAGEHEGLISRGEKAAWITTLSFNNNALHIHFDQATFIDNLLSSTGVTTHTDASCPILVNGDVHGKLHKLLKCEIDPAPSQDTQVAERLRLTNWCQPMSATTRDNEIMLTWDGRVQ